MLHSFILLISVIPLHLYNYAAKLAAPAAPIVTEEAIEAIVVRVTGTDLLYTVSLLFFYCRLFVFDAVARR